MLWKIRSAQLGLASEQRVRLIGGLGGSGIALLVAACSSGGSGDINSGPPDSGKGGGSSVVGSSGASGQQSLTAGSGGAGTAGTGTAGSAPAGVGASGSTGVGGAPLNPGTAGAPGAPSGGSSTGGATGVPGAGTAGLASSGTAGASQGTGGADSCPPVEQLDKFSFFVTSYRALQRLSGSPDGFGGDLRYGEADGLSGADKICAEIAEYSMPCAGKKQWRAFLSATKGGPNGGPVHAIDRIGEGPWYDRVERIVAMNKAALLNRRPEGADPAIINDLPNEDGVPNHDPDGTGPVDNHDMLTGTNDKGQLYTVRADPLESTCKDWTSAERWGKPRVGHPWPTGAGSGGGGFPFPGGSGGGGGNPVPGFPGVEGIGDLANWMSALDEAGCAPGASLVEMGPPMANNPIVGSGGGYGGFYCFALTP